MDNNDMAASIGKLMSDPRFADVLSTLSGSVKKSDADTDAQPDGGVTPDKPPQSESAPGDNKKQDSSGISISPEMMAKLPQIMSALSPLMNKAAPEKQLSKPQNEAEMRRQLLAALKPYLSDARRDALDSVMKAADLKDLFGNLTDKS